MPQASYCSACGSRIFMDSQGQDTADPYLGQVIDNTFVVESILGTGSMGIVYKARHRALDCYVALKVLRHDFLRDRVVLARFQREAQAASSLDHPNVIRILHYGKTHLGAPYIAMECLDGDELSALVPKAFPMQQKRVCRIALQTARALSAAHAANIIHRDLKPANIVVILNDKGEEIVKVLDFGIAKIADVEGEGLTKEGAVCGTPAFMSPEQVLGRTVTPISDIFSLGCVMYFMLTCRLPFQGQSMVDMATAILTTNPTPPSKVRLDTYVDPSLERICLKALSKEPEGRYQSALEMVRDLEEVYKNMPDVDPHVRPKIVVGEPDILDDLDAETRCGINVREMGIDDDDGCTQLEVPVMGDDMVATAESGVAPVISPAILPPQAKSGYPSRRTSSPAGSTPTITTKWPVEDEEDDGNAFFTRQLRERNKRLMILAVSIALGVSLLGILVAFIVSRSSHDEEEMIQAELEEIEKEVQAEPVKTSVDIFFAVNKASENSERGLVVGCSYGLLYADKGTDDNTRAEDDDELEHQDDVDANDSDKADEDVPPVVEPPKVDKPKVEKPKTDKPKKTTPKRPASSSGSSFADRFMEAGRLERAGEKDRACAIYRSLLKSPGLGQSDKFKVQAKLRTCSRIPI